jgi:hypothetical protein
MTVGAEAGFADADLAPLKQAGYAVERGAAAVASVVAIDPKTGEARPASR